MADGKSVTVSGSRVITLTAEGATLEEAVATYRKLHGSTPDSWETEDADGIIIGVCEFCEKPIVERTGEVADYAVDAEGCIACRDCVPEWEEETTP